MFGKGAVFLVLGFSGIFMFYAMQLLNYSTTSLDVYSRYYQSTMSNNLALTGANFACNAIYQTPGWSAGYNNISFAGGTIKVTVDNLANERKKITSVSNFNGYKDTVIVLVQPSSFSKFGNFYSKLTAYPATGDTFDGPFHTNDNLNVSGNPVFLGKATSKKALVKKRNPSNPVFCGGYETGVNIPLNLNTNDYRSLATGGGKLFESSVSSKSFINVDLTFNNNGTVTYKQRIGKNKTTWDSWSAPVTVPASFLAPNGIIFIAKGNVTMRGVVNGQYTVVTGKQGGEGMGNVYLDNSITYKTDPRTNPASTDMLGIVADEDITVTYNNSRGDIDIHASMFSQNSGLVVENYSSYSSIHNMRILGGIIGTDAYATADYSSFTGLPIRGYRFIHKFDKRFLVAAPPKFPTTTGFEIVSWYE
jgi:hypothetical protein